MEQNTTFTFTFTGKKAEEIAERFAAYFWDGGLDEYIEQSFLAQYNLDADAFQFDAKNHVIVDTNNAII